MKVKPDFDARDGYREFDIIGLGEGFRHNQLVRGMMILIKNAPDLIEFGLFSLSHLNRLLDIILRIAVGLDNFQVHATISAHLF